MRIFFIIFLFSANASSDILQEIMNGTYSIDQNVVDDDQNVVDDFEFVEPEIYHWELGQPDNRTETIVIVDPYGKSCSCW